jgi:hypothetical protein
MKKWLAPAVLLLPLFLAGCSHPHPAYVEPPPPPDFPAIAQQGYHDGFAAARHDAEHGKPPDIERHPKFRHPPVPPPAGEEYRTRFQERLRDVSPSRIAAATEATELQKKLDGPRNGLRCARHTQAIRLLRLTCLCS